MGKHCEHTSDIVVRVFDLGAALAFADLLSHCGYTEVRVVRRDSRIETDRWYVSAFKTRQKSTPLGTLGARILSNIMRIKKPKPVTPPGGALLDYPADTVIKMNAHHA